MPSIEIYTSPLCGFCHSAKRLLKEKEYSVVGVDPSSDGIALAKEIDPETRLSVGSAYDPLSERFGQFPALVSLEVVEHVYYPRK